MRRTVLVALALSLVAGVLTGCARKVEVSTGEIVLCRYGHTVKDDVRSIEVPAREAGEYSVETTTIVCPLHRRMEDLYAKAQEALAAGDLAAAEKLLAEVVAGDAGFRKAATQLADVKAGRKPQPDRGGSQAPGSSSATSSPDDEGRLPVSGDMRRYVPEDIPGFTAQSVVVDPVAVSRMYLPKGASDVGQLIIAVEQYTDAAHAKAAIDSGVKRSYSGSPSEVRVPGHVAYFGTDGTRFAVLAFNDGAVLVVFEMYAAKGPPTALKDDLAKAAEAVLE